MSDYKKNSLNLAGAVSLGTGVMIGAAIFALVGQVAELAGAIFPWSLLAGGIIAGFSSYAYVKMSDAYPSAGGIAMYLKKAYGESTITAWAALLMAFAMVINQSLVAKTFGTYTLQLFNVEKSDFWAAALGVGLLILVFLINLSGNKNIQRTSFIMAIVKIGGIVMLAVAGLWAAGFSMDRVIPDKFADEYNGVDYLGAFALSVLAYAGFTTITNSGDEIKKPHKNVGRAIVIALVICTVIYLLIALAVSSNLSVEKVIKARDYALAEAARPAFGKTGVWITVLVAIIATISGVLANVFAVSRMTAMLTKMKLIPHSHFGMPGRIQKHMLVYSIVIAIALTVLFDLTRIASIGIIFYLMMDIVIQWGVLRKLRKKVEAHPVILIITIVMDILALGGFLWARAAGDWLIVVVAVVLMIIIFVGERWFISINAGKSSN